MFEFLASDDTHASIRVRTFASTAVMLVVAGLSGGCLQSDGFDVELLFEASDYDGSPLVVGEVYCDGVNAAEEGYTLGVIEQRGPTEYACLMPEEFGMMYFEVARPNRVTSSYSNRLPLRMWDPVVTVEAVGDQLVVSWDLPAPEVPVQPGWRVRQSISAPGVGNLELDATATQIALPLAPYTEQERAEIRLYASVTGPEGGSVGHEVVIPVALPLP